MTAIDPNYPLAAGGASAAEAVRAADGDDFELAQLPPYARSLLRIRVPVVVTLAATRQPVSRVLELAPGTILHFSKPCDEPLSLSVGSCEVAVGETVKIGEKFGLRITSMVMPLERFESVRPGGGGRRQESGVRGQGPGEPNKGEPNKRGQAPLSGIEA